MPLPDGQPLIVADGILHEPSPEGILILWLPGERGEGYQHWERVATVARATVATERGVRSIAATSVPARRRLGGLLGRFLLGLKGPNGERAWTLPDGATAEQCGARQADRRLAWPADESTPLDAARIRDLWPVAREIRALGPDLYLVSGIEPERPGTVQGPGSGQEAAAAASQGSPRELAERALAAARTAGDSRRQVTARVDLGLILLYEGEARRAAELMEGALSEARRLGDQALEADTSSNLALAVGALGETGRAREYLTKALAHARDVGDLHAEKLALDRLAAALLSMGDRAGALSHLERAGAIAAATGDIKHEADLLWRAAVEHAELGRRDRALAGAEAALARLRRLGHPATHWYERHLADYRSGATGAGPADLGAADLYLGGSIDIGASAARQASANATGPGLLRMAVTATKAMAKFVGSGFKTVSPESYRDRLAVCVACPHHTGVRCRICGCITAVKARALHERCPAGRWPA